MDNNFIRSIKLLTIAFVISAPSLVFAQYDPMFTQYMFNEMYINPAYAGSRECISATALYRNQWSGIEGSPKTQTFSIHGPLQNQKVGIGLNLLNEEIGVTHNTVLFSNYAYRVQLGKGKFSLGLQAGIINHQDRFLELNTATDGDPKFSANTPNLILPNAGFGMYYYTETFYAGFSIPRLIENRIDVSKNKMVTNTTNSKYWHYFTTVGKIFTLNENYKLKPAFMIKVVKGAPVEFDLNSNIFVKEKWWLGCGYRSGDAFTCMTGFQFTPQFRMGYSFDYTTTELQDYSHGSHEITIGYDFSFNKKRVITPRLF